MFSIMIGKSENNVSTGLILKKIWDGVRPHRVLFWFSFIAFTISPIINALIPLLYKQFFDILGEVGDKVIAVPTLIYIIYFILLLNAIRWLVIRVGMFLHNKTAAKVMARLRQNAFDYLMLHSYNFFANNFGGSLVQRISRFARAYDKLADTMVFNVIPLFVTIVISVVVTWTELPIISWIIIAWAVGIITISILFSRWKMKYDVSAAAADSRTTGFVSDSITNHNTVTLFTGYKGEVDSFKEITGDQANKTLFSWRMGEIADAIQALFIVAVEFFVFYYAIFFWGKGLMTIGTFVLIQVYIIDLAGHLWGLNRIIRNIYESMADAKELVEIITLPYEIKDIPRAKTLMVEKGEIEFKDVTFNFNQTRKVLDNVNVVIPAGQKIALAGHSGAGKTTFVRTILRFYDLTSGKISIDGQNISKVTQDSLRLNVSLVPQDPILFHRTLMENIRYGRRDATDEEVFLAARLAHCDDFIEDLPLKYETFVGERGIKLSGGERQRVAIARAILKNAPIIIFDEATSSLDSHSEALIQDALDTLMKGRTTIIIAHRLSTIRKMDRIIVMDDGQVVEDGTHEELIVKDEGIYQKLWNLQVKGFVQE